MTLKHSQLREYFIFIEKSCRNYAPKASPKPFLNIFIYSLANSELNYTPFWCVWGIYHNLMKLFKQVP